MSKKKQKKVDMFNADDIINMKRDIVLDLDEVQQANAWLNENNIPHRIDPSNYMPNLYFPIQVAIGNVGYRFKTEEDAVAFKLAWT